MSAKEKPVTQQTFRTGGHHCRHCGDKHIKGLRRANAKNMESLESDVLELLKTGIARGFLGESGQWNVQREPIAAHFDVPEHQIDQVMQSLKLRGFVGTATNQPPHDSTRDEWGGGDSSWMGSLIPVHFEKFKSEFGVSAPNPRPARRTPS